MKKVIILASLFLSISVGTMAQNPAQTNKTNNGISSQTNRNATGSAEGLKRRGNGQESPKMKEGVSRNGNSNLSPTGPTNTQGSTSEGSASVPSAGGAQGTNTRSSRTSTNTGGVKGAQNTKNNTASDGGTTGPGATGGNSRNTTREGQNRTSTNSTSGYTGGSKRPTSTADVRKESRTNDRNVGTGYPEPTGVGKPGTPSGNAKGNKGKTGKTENYPQ